MKVKDLPGNTKLSDIKVDLRPLIKYQNLSLNLRGTTGYLMHGWKSGIWIKVDKNDTRLYPIFGEFSKEDILNLDVIEE